MTCRPGGGAPGGGGGGGGGGDSVSHRRFLGARPGGTRNVWRPESDDCRCSETTFPGVSARAARTSPPPHTGVGGEAGSAVRRAAPCGSAPTPLADLSPVPDSDALARQPQVPHPSGPEPTVPVGALARPAGGHRGSPQQRSNGVRGPVQTGLARFALQVLSFRS